MSNGVVANAAVTPKVAVSGIAGSLVVVLLWVLGLFHVTVPAEVASALTVIISFVAGYIAPRSTPPDPPPVPGQPLMSDKPKL